MSRSPSEKKPQYYDRRATAEYRGESVSSVIRDEKAGRLTPVRFRKRGKVHYVAEQVEAPAEVIPHAR